LQIVEEALLDDCIVSSTILPEEVVGQHARKRWLRIRGLAVWVHALDAASLLSVPRSLCRLLYLLQYPLHLLRSTLSAYEVIATCFAVKSR
jgi:hypothetical protein